jgi:hypothetical protein
MAAVALEEFEDFIRSKIEKERWTHSQLIEHLQSSISGKRGFSVRSIERFCSTKGIHRTSRLDDTQVEELVREAVDRVGPSYGRKTLTGLLASERIVVGQQRVGRALGHVSPSYHIAQQTCTARQIILVTNFTLTKTRS